MYDEARRARRRGPRIGIMDIRRIRSAALRLSLAFVFTAGLAPFRAAAQTQTPGSRPPGIREDLSPRAGLRLSRSSAETPATLPAVSLTQLPGSLVDPV